MILKILISAAITLVLCGCIWEPYHETTYYDLNCAKIVTAQKDAPQIYVVEFENLTNAESRMQMRFDNGRIVTDSYAKWILPPGELIPRALNELFVNAKLTGAERRISGRLFKFEADNTERVFNLTGTWKFEGSKQYQTFEIKTPLDDYTPKQISKAASSAVEKLATEIFTANFDTGR